MLKMKDEDIKKYYLKPLSPDKAELFCMHCHKYVNIIEVSDCESTFIKAYVYCACSSYEFNHKYLTEKIDEVQKRVLSGDGKSKLQLKSLNEKLVNIIQVDKIPKNIEFWSVLPL